MKKTLFIIALCALALSASAQFKVHGNDNSSYYVTCNSVDKNGFSITKTGSGPGTAYGGQSNVSYNGPTRCIIRNTN